MSIEVVVHNHDGHWFKMDRACFGFLSYINQWDEDDVEDHGGPHPQNIDGEDDCGLQGYESANLKSVDFFAHGTSELLASLEKAMAGIPQYYGNVTVSEEGTTEKRINIPLGPDVKMQVATISGMMLRNITDYSNYRTGFLKLIEKGVPEAVAFVISQAFPYRHNGLQAHLSGFYRAFGGDDTIFKGESRLCDMAAMLNGELGDAWQGCFGDTDNGYGRYGDYDGDNSPTCDRTKYRKDLANVTLISDEKVWSESPLLNNAEALGIGVRENNDRIFITVDDMVNKFVPKLQELLK